MSAVHPVVRIHPDTGRKALFVNKMHIERFEGMTLSESQPLLNYLYEHSTRPEFTCRFRWEPGSIPYIKSGHLRALAIGDDHRSPSLPDLPTVAEAGVPGFQANLWSGMFVPNGTPAPVINRLNEVLVKALKDPTFAKTMEDHGFEPAGTTPAQCDAFIVKEIAKWATVAKDAGIVAE
jgi:hypothetical protein